jgi:hypothetical protein
MHLGARASKFEPLPSLILNRVSTVALLRPFMRPQQGTFFKANKMHTHHSKKVDEVCSPPRYRTPLVAQSGCNEQATCNI